MNVDTRLAIATLWPSFIMACIGEAVFFTLFDPVDLAFFGIPAAEMSRLTIYSVGFFLLWLFAAAASYASLWLYRHTPRSDTNEAPGRP